MSSVTIVDIQDYVTFTPCVGIYSAVKFVLFCRS